MCNFHNAVAVLAATDPVTGKINLAEKIVIQIALSRYWAERYVEGGDKVNGYNPYPLALREQQAAFERSGLKKPLPEIEKAEVILIDCVRVALQDLGKFQDISYHALGLPIRTALADFVDMAVMNLYEGDPKGAFNIVDKPARADLVPIHRAISYLHANPEVSSALEELVKGKIAALYILAPGQVNHSLINAYESLPETARVKLGKLSKFGGNIALGGFSGMIGHSIHYGSVLGAGITAGTASSLNLGLSGFFAAASYAGWHQFFGGKYRDFKNQAYAMGLQVGLAAGVAFGAQPFLGHNHMESEQALWLESLPDDIRKEFVEGERAKFHALPAELQRRVMEEAEKENVPVELFLLLCDGNNQVTQDVNAYLSEQKNNYLLNSYSPTP